MSQVQLFRPTSAPDGHHAKLTAGVDLESGEVFINSRVALMPAQQAILCAGYDGVSFIEHEGEVLLPSKWVRSEIREHHKDREGELLEAVAWVESSAAEMLEQERAENPMDDDLKQPEAEASATPHLHRPDSRVDLYEADGSFGVSSSCQDEASFRREFADGMLLCLGVEHEGTRAIDQLQGWLRDFTEIVLAYRGYKSSAQQLVTYYSGDMLPDTADAAMPPANDGGGI